MIKPISPNLEKIMVPICTDHFARLVGGHPCQQCPSRAESEAEVMEVAEQFQNGQTTAMAGLLAEVRSIRRAQTDLHLIVTTHIDEARKVQHVVIGVDGENGLRSRIRVVEGELNSLKKFVWVGIGIATLAGMVLPSILHVAR
jgi:hypothetical protein